MVEINRVAKVVKGGRRFSFTALVVIGDEVDRVGVGYGKAREVPLAITKAVDDAKKNLFRVPKHGTTITHEVLGRFDAARVCSAPPARAPASSPAAACAPCSSSAGIRDMLAKSLGTTNPINMAKATVNALQSLRRPEDVARARGKTIARGAARGVRRRRRGRGRARRPLRAAEDAPAEPAPADAAEAEPSAARRRAEVAASAAETVEAAASRRRRPRPTKDERLMAKLRVTQVRSQIGQSERHRGTLRALGLGKIGRSAEHEESPLLAGMLRKVRHLVQVEEA